MNNDGAAEARPTVLCVDDELSVLAGLSRQLRRHFSISIAESGSEALELIRARADDPYAVIVSDMMMPGMSGAEFLRRSRDITPDSVRVVLTGQADADLAAAAVNEGAITHYLTKPCSTEVMLATLAECTEIFRRTALERAVLEQTLNAALDALGQTLALVAPEVFSRAVRVRSLVRTIADATGIADRWPIEAAVLLSQLGALSLPPAMLHRWAAGAPLTREAATQAATIPSISAAITRTIPRLEEVARIIEGTMPGARATATARRGAEVLTFAFELDRIESAGVERHVALEQLAASTVDHRRLQLVEALRELPPSAAHAVKLTELSLGMVIARDVVSVDGALLVGRGAPVSPTLAARLRNFRAADTIGATVMVDDAAPPPATG